MTVPACRIAEETLALRAPRTHGFHLRRKGWQQALSNSGGQVRLSVNSLGGWLDPDSSCVVEGCSGWIRTRVGFRRKGRRLHA